MKLLKYGFLAAAVSSTILTIYFIQNYTYHCISSFGTRECWGYLAPIAVSITITIFFLSGFFGDPKKNKE